MGKLNSGGVCMKVFLVVLNTIFCVAGCMMLIAGIWMMVDNTILTYLGFNGDENDTINKTAAIVVFVLGVITFIVGFFGALGAATESPCHLVTYGSLLSIFVILEILTVVLGVVFSPKFNEVLRNNLNKVKPTPEEGDEMNIVMHNLQRQLKCCGVNNFTDYETMQELSGWSKMDKGNYTYYLPASCCDQNNLRENNVEVGCLDDNGQIGDLEYTYLYYKQGCLSALTEWFEDKITIFIAVAVSVGVVQIIGVILAFLLRRQIDSHY